MAKAEAKRGGQRQERHISRSETAASRAEHGASELDPMIHERIRLGIVSALAVNERMTFNELKRVLNTTDGNLSVHARKLEEAGYLGCDKYFDGRVPKTEYWLTGTGRKSLQRYLDQMEAIIRAARQG